MSLIRHFNVPDVRGEIYCCLRNRVVVFDEEQKTSFCAGCRMFGGDAGGRGVMCDWDDAELTDNPYTVTDPHEEWTRNQTRTITPGLQPPDYGLFLANDR